MGARGSGLRRSWRPKVCRGAHLTIHSSRTCFVTAKAWRKIPPRFCLHYASRLNSGVRPHEKPLLVPSRKRCTSVCGSRYLGRHRRLRHRSRALAQRAHRSKLLCLALIRCLLSNWCNPIGLGNWHSTNIPKSPRACACTILGRAFRNDRVLARHSRVHMFLLIHGLVSWGLTIRSSRTCFATPTTWQEELAMLLAPLRKSA